MLRLVAVVIRSLASLVRSRRELLLENLALRQQLAMMVQKGRPRIRTADRPEFGRVVEVAEAGGLYRHYERRAA